MELERINVLIRDAGLNSGERFVTVHRWDGQRLLTTYSSHPMPEPLGTWQPVTKGITGQAAIRRQPVYSSDVRDEPSYFPIYPNVQSELAIPVLEDDSVVAVVNFESTAEDGFAGWDKSIFPRIAEEVKKFLELERIDSGREMFVPSDLLVGSKSPTDCRIAIEDVSETLLRSLAEKPELLYGISPRRFEEVVARILEDQGYMVQLTAPQKDGGFDIFVEAVTPLGRLLTLVECKRYSPENPVRVDLVRSLYGILNMERASQALIVTTSYFTSDARSLQSLFKYQLSLRDFNGVCEWLERYR